MDSGVATRPIEDFSAYTVKNYLSLFITLHFNETDLLSSKTDPKRIAYAEGEDQRVLRAVQIVVDEGFSSTSLDWSYCCDRRQHQKIWLYVYNMA